MRAMCEKVGRDFDELKWSLYLSTSVIGKDPDDFEKKKEERLKQHWLFEEIPEEMKPKVVEAMLKQSISGTADEAIEKISEYEEEVDIMVLGLPMMGNLLKNGLDTIKILKEKIVPRLEHK
jgi:alkanesulfonate monooxygenase SsuD/methylene tetrahydromethanopterin reductase-like flavin-dependent oxidoreductase (luciferase family)